MPNFDTSTREGRIAWLAAGSPEPEAKTGVGRRAQHKDEVADTIATPDLTLFAGAVTRKLPPAMRGKVVIQAIGENGPLHQDVIAFASGKERTRFLKKVVKKLGLEAANLEAAETEL